MRCWYNTYVLKLQVFSDMSYANAGTVVHTCIESFYKKEDNIKELFESKWKSFRLDESILKNKKDEYWIMYLNCINKNIELTSQEFKIFYDDVVGYIDGINTLTDEIHDWKSSTRSQENEEEYSLQLKFYAYLFHRKFYRVPKKLVCHYLKHSGSKGELEINPTLEDVNFARKWHEETRELISNALEQKKFPKCIDEGKDCHFFCPFKDQCLNKEEELQLILKIIGNYIQIIGPVTPLLNKGIEKKFSYELKNSHFIKKHRPSFDGIVHFYNAKHQMLPIGFLKPLIKTLTDYAEFKKLKLNLKIEDKRNEYKNSIILPEQLINKELRSYQEEAINSFLKEKIAILEVATGAGKTLIATECIRRLGCKTLFVVDKIELLTQTKKVIEESLGIKVGMIGRGEDDIKDITVATIQTLVKNIQKYEGYLNEVCFAIFDECHHVSSKSYEKLARSLRNTQYRLGLSGTAFRDDGNDMAITSIVGEKCYSLRADELIEKGYLMKPNIIFKRINLTDKEIKQMEQNALIGLINEKPNYSNFYKEFIANNVKRNEKVMEVIRDNEGKKILILTKLVEHGTLLAESIPGAIHLYGGTNKQERKDLMVMFRNDNFKILVSTISIFSEGIDIPELDVVINTAANKGDVKSIQVLGRVLRKNNNKDMALYYDFFDDSYKFFMNASKARIRIFRKEGHGVELE